jgi:hypothetical protein
MENGSSRGVLEMAVLVQCLNRSSIEDQARYKEQGIY